MVLSVLPGCDSKDKAIQFDREEVVMRKIGHNILLSVNDSVSLVQPIIFEEGKYRIQFKAQFSFLPDTLIKTIDEIIKAELPYDNYLVQIEECETKQVVYSYEIDLFSPPNEVIACSTREQPKSCYEIIIQLIPNKESSYLLLYILLIAFILSIISYYLIKNKRNTNDEHIKIGAYLYNPKMMTLTLNNTIELTSKESELLNLLYESVNETVDRETILNKVWSDEGDYIGRTLDVYISKLRKKLENDSSIQLKNIRGIGYKLIVEV